VPGTWWQRKGGEAVSFCHTAGACSPRDRITRTTRHGVRPSGPESGGEQRRLAEQQQKYHEYRKLLGKLNPIYLVTPGKGEQNYE